MTDWQNLTEHDAIEAAVAEYGKGPSGIGRILRA